MSDEQVRQAKLGLQVVQQLEDLGLDGNVERRHWLVEHDQARFNGQRAGDPDPLALASAELVRIAGNCIHREPYQLQELLDPLAALFLRHQVVDTQRLADELAYGVARVQGGDRVLEDDLHVAA